ncbi:MAG: hypothetical protein P8Y23_01865, partial [Candidatus Lokiarchaeota archaeon]
LSLNKSSVCTDDVDLQTISLNYLFSNYPIFTPLVSFSDSEIKSSEHKISHIFKIVDYCNINLKIKNLIRMRLENSIQTLMLKRF